MSRSPEIEIIYLALRCVTIIGLAALGLAGFYNARKAVREGIKWLNNSSASSSLLRGSSPIHFINSGRNFKL